MSDIPTDMIPDLAEWNGGKGIDLETWIGCEGGFKLAVGYTTIFWPRFVVVRDLLLRDCFTEAGLADWEKNCGDDKHAIETVINHIHLRDMHHYGCPDISVDRIRFIGRILKEIYEAKLSWQFPDRPCTVKFLEPEDLNNFTEYQIVFWQKKHEKKV